MAGKMGAINAVGCIGGALITGFLAIPKLGSEATFLVLMLLMVGCSLILTIAHLRGRRRLALLAVGAIAILFISHRPAWNRLSLTSGEQVYFAPNQVFPVSKLLFFHEDILGGITTVVANPAGVRRETRPYLTLLTNGKFQGNDAWEVDAQIAFAMIPIMLTSGRGAALVIGLGTGQSGHVVQAMGFKSIDVAEISPGIVDAARSYFGKVNGNLLDRPNVALHLEDGRNLLLLSHRRYNLITMEISSVWFSGSTNLYSQEFYELARRHLKPGGMFQQWIQLHHIGTRELGSVIATLRSVFPHVSLWVAGGQGILIGSLDSQVVRPQFLRDFKPVAHNLGWADANLPARFRWLLSARLLAPKDVDRFVVNHHPELNTDRNRYLEYSTPRYQLIRVNLIPRNIRALGEQSSFTPVPLDPRCRGSLTAVSHSISRNDLMKRFGFRPAAPTADDDHRN